KRDGTLVQNWSDLEPHQQDKVIDDMTLVEELEIRSEISAERGYPGAQGYATLLKLEQQRIKRGEALVTDFNNELMDARTFRNEVTKLKLEIASRRSQVDEDFQLFKETGKIEKDPNKRARNEYYNTFELAKKQSGAMDWDRQATLEAILRRKWTPTQEAYVDRNIGLTEWGPLFDVFDQSRKALSEYWDVPREKQDKFLVDNPDIESHLLLWGYRTIPSTIEAALQLEADAAKNGIPQETIQAFSLTDKGKERLPSDRELWEDYFDYYDLPGTSYLNMTQNQVDAGLLPARYRKEWETYNKLKTDIAREFYRRAHKRAAYSQWRQDFRRINREFDRWLIDQEYNKPLKRRTARRTTRRTGRRTAGISVASTGIRGGTRRPTRATTVPSFRRPRISRGLSVRAPGAPR
ncbi:hypothetical protein LCGC14_1140530, partial [marine sediment metagenome]